MKGRGLFTLLTIGVLMMTLGIQGVRGQSSSGACEDIAVLPHEITLRHASDARAEEIDTHTFLRFFTYQMPYDEEPQTNMIKTRFDPSKGVHGEHEQQVKGERDLLLRLRASLKSSEMDYIAQTMRVSVIEEQSGKVVIDGTTEEDDQRSVHLDSIDISSSKTYIIKYEFFEKNAGLLDLADSTISAAHMGATACNRPFVVQEMVLISKDLMKHRAATYRDNLMKSKKEAEEELSISKLTERCPFSSLNNGNGDQRAGEQGLYCVRQSYKYNLAGSSSKELNEVFKTSFNLIGVANQPVTYLFDLTLGFDFASSAQLKAVLRRVDKDTEESSFIQDPLSCLYDHTCVESDQVSKNEQSIYAILTQGSYQLMIYDQQENSVRRWLVNDAELEEVPFTFELTAVPVIQNEERVMCGQRLYLAEHFIQNRFLEGQKGQRFVFDEEILLSLVNSTHKFRLKPEADMLLKISSREANGVNMGISICRNERDGQENCFAKSEQIGNTEILMAVVKKDTEYWVSLDYSNSIIQMSTFFDCPHAHLRIAMVQTEEMDKKMEAMKIQEQQWLQSKQKESESVLADAFNSFSQDSAETGIQLEQILTQQTDFVYETGRNWMINKPQTKVVTQRGFSVQGESEREIVVEIFYDPFLYDLEILIQSVDGGEVRSKMLRGSSSFDETGFKGSKRVFAGLEKGDYQFKVIAKVPASHQETKKYVPSYVEFQLYLSSGSEIPEQFQRAQSLNYFGLLGPEGQNYGQFVHLIDNLELKPREQFEQEFFLTVNGKMKPNIDVQVIETSGSSEQIGVSIDPIQSENSSISIRPKVSKYFDDQEEAAAYESLMTSDIQSGQHYRLVVVNRDSAATLTLQLKLVISEDGDFFKGGSRKRENLPSKFSDLVRVKPKVPGLKESSFIQGSRAVMEAFQVATLRPFVPKTQEVFQGGFKTGPDSDDTFMHSLDFEIKEPSAQLFAQVIEFSGREDLFITVYSIEDEDSEEMEEVARSSLGKYANSLGPVTLTQGKYSMVIHPDQDSDKVASGEEIIKFGLDVLLEQEQIGTQNYDVVIEEVELCSLPSLPDNFNGPGYIHPLSGFSLDTGMKLRLTEALQGTSVKFTVDLPSLVIFYMHVPEGLKAQAQLVKLQGTHQTSLSSEDLNKGDESFLRKEGGFQHRAVIQFREFLDKGSYIIKIQAKDGSGRSSKIMPRCEAFQIHLMVDPLYKQHLHAHLGDECSNSFYIPERMAYDQVRQGKLSYPLRENTVDVTYLDLKQDGEGPFIFFFEIQYDVQMAGVVGLSLSQYDNEKTLFKQTALYRSPQDGVTQIFTVVESGVYAIGIQTLSSTHEMFLWNGLTSKERKEFGDKLLHQSCLDIKYTYLVTTSKKHDQRAIDGGAFGLLAMMLTGNLQRLAKQHQLDVQLISEIGDTRSFKECPHDDLPVSFPLSETGFDSKFTLLIRQKPFDVIDLNVEQDSLVRVQIITSRTQNQVNAFIFQDQDQLTKKGSPLAWQKGSRSHGSLFTTLKPQKKAYKLKLEYESLDQNDPCPTFELRVVSKPVKDVISEDVDCQGHPLPPSSIYINSTDFAFSGTYSFPSDFLDSFKKRKSGSITYDIVLDWHDANPQDEYYLDIQTKSDFLASAMQFQLMYEDKDKVLRPLGKSIVVKQEGSSKQLVQKLKLLEIEGEMAGGQINLSGAILRLKIPSHTTKLAENLRRMGILERKDEICHNFELSLRAEKLGSDPNETGQPRLVRVRWEGQEVSQGTFDPQQRLTAVIEFDRSIQGTYQFLKSTDWAMLVGTNTTQSGSTRDRPDPVSPTIKKIDPNDPSQLIVTFPAGSLAKGWCYHLTLSSPLINFEEEVVKADLDVCASNCMCDWVGTSKCNEASGKCICKFPHIGSTCSECEKGHSRDPVTGQCRPSGLCKDLGGDEDCNGHGSCNQRGGVAVCECDKGFANDGLDQCGKCEDPLFKYPDCQVRNWILEEPDINCADLDYKMPRTLFQRKGSNSTRMQSDDGVLNWGKRYKLMDGRNMRKSSTHKFIVTQSSVLRLFLDTSLSGSLVKYRLIDNQKTELVSSSLRSDSNPDGFLNSASEVLILHRPKDMDPKEAPFTLLLEYSHEDVDYSDPDWEQKCPTIDVRMILEPLVTAESAIKCSSSELTQSQEKLQKQGWQFNSQKKFIKEKVVLRSDDQSLFEQVSKKDVNFAKLSFPIDISSSGNALSIVTTYPFASLVTTMQLKNQETGGIVGVETTASLEGNERVTPYIRRLNDMTTYIEVPSIESGRYTLEIAIPRAYFLPTKKYQTCLGFDLVIEYIVRDVKKEAEAGVYDVLSVRPMEILGMRTDDAKVIEVDLDKPIVLDDLVSSQADRFYICKLVSKSNPSQIINPAHIEVVSKKTLRLDFDFKRTPPSFGGCFQLVCSTMKTKDQELFLPIQVETNYCFESQSDQSQDLLSKCNPLADPKLSQNGDCICAQPYSGPACEQCQNGFVPIPVDPNQFEDGKTHNRCVIDINHVNSAFCNDHGSPKSHSVKSYQEIECECDPGFAGKFCDYCEDSSFAYPDCNEKLSATIYDPEEIHAYLSRRKYDEHGYSTVAQRYFKKGELEPTVFNEECGWVDFPDDLDKIEYSKEFSDSGFHVADVYVVNHKQDNIIKFTPKHTGFFKILVQQPEIEEALSGKSSEAFDIEVGLYDSANSKFLQSSMNRHLLLPSGAPLKLEYAAMNFEFDQSHLDRPFYLFFRALNFSDSEIKQSEGCASLFIEIEFQSTKPQCLHDPTLEPATDITVLKDSQIQAVASFASQAGVEKGSIHSITDPYNTFFTFQDYYLPETDGKFDQGDIEVTISLQQKFIESNSLDLLIEVLEEDVSLQDIDKSKYSPKLSRFQESKQIHKYQRSSRDSNINGIYGPKCSGVCLIGGEKAFNEMLRVVELSPKTYIRVWVFQQIPSSVREQQEWCSNFQLVVSQRPVMVSDEQEKKQAEALHCKADELPESLNSGRYLDGLDGKQQDFHVRQSYRVDHLWHNKAHHMQFNLQEPTLIRVVAPIHPHLQFEMILAEDHSSYDHKTVIRAKREDYHSTIFAQLSPGRYHIKLLFVSDSSVVQLPCQTVQLEMAFMTVERAKQRQQILRENSQSKSVQDMSLSMLLTKQDHTPISLFKQSKVGWRQVSPGIPPYIDQQELFVEVFREGFEIAEDDEAGILVEVQSDFLLSGLNFAVANVQTGQILEDQGRDASNRLVVGKLAPGKYELLIYTHECITNMDPHNGIAISSFDIALQVITRLVRMAELHDQNDVPPAVNVDILDFSSGRNGDVDAQVKEQKQMAPLMFTKHEIKCMKEYLPLPERLDGWALSGRVDLHETFFIPQATFHSHHIRFTASAGQDAIQVLVVKANTMIAVYELESRSLVTQSKPMDNGKTQLLVASKLRVGTVYAIIIEFSEEPGSVDGNAHQNCDHFVLSIRTWDSTNLCRSQEFSSFQESKIQTGQDSQTSIFNLNMKTKVLEKEIVVKGDKPLELVIGVDSIDTLYKPELTLSLKDENKSGMNSKESVVKNIMHQIKTDDTDYSRKQLALHSFKDISPGTYVLKLRQRFKSKGCSTYLTLTVRTQESTKSQAHLSTGVFGSQVIFQSQSEEQERPRNANRLPMDLDGYKFMGGQHEIDDSSKKYHALFSGPVQVSDVDSQNIITFTVKKNGTQLRAYGEHSGLVMTLAREDGDKTLLTDGASEGMGIFHILNEGSYRLKLGLGSAQARQMASIQPPRIQLTVMLAEPEAMDLFQKTWTNNEQGCAQGANFPLALRQQKQADIHRLYYNYPLIKVSPSVLQLQSVLQTYNFRINATSRVYFEVGMHFLTSHVSLQLQSLNEKSFTVVGKQRGNLNVIDTELGPGDYSVALKQTSKMSSLLNSSTCAIFSLQGLVEAINLMSAQANSGQIAQRGFASCQEASNGDVLPMKIYGSKQQTKGGGELHVDATGHFMKRFRNVVYKHSRAFSDLEPEFDRVELQVVEDAILELSFLSDAETDADFKVIVADTYMLGQEIPPLNRFEVSDILNHNKERFTSFQLFKGRHYSLTIFYLGGEKVDQEGNQECITYDLTFSIAHQHDLMQQTRCTQKDDFIPSFKDGLPKNIGENDLDKNGAYKFSQILKIEYPKDFKGFEKSKEGQINTVGAPFGEDSLDYMTFINLDRNFDIKASVEFEFDEAYFTLSLDELSTNSDGEMIASTSSLQAPLSFKGNNDHFRSMTRELVADDVQSKNSKKEHVLMIQNRMPDFLHQISPDPNSRGCLFAKVMIHIQATDRKGKNLYVREQSARVSPMVLGCKPETSPTFLHGRPEEVDFTVILNQHPYAKQSNGQLRKATKKELKEVLMIKAVYVNLQDASQGEVKLPPATISIEEKEYIDNQVHIELSFDLSEYMKSGSEKLIYTQLLVYYKNIYDANGNEFDVNKDLQSKGFPIYVLEETDTEQILKEESSEVQQAAEGSVISGESVRQMQTDTSTEASEFDKEVAQKRHEDETKKEQVKCLCVHGKCRDGEAECAGPCDKGWTGTRCDTPQSNSEIFTRVNTNTKKDYTRDGLYRPKQITDERMTGPAKRIEDDLPQTQPDSSSQQGKKVVRIDDDESSSSQSQRPLQVLNLESLPEPTIETESVSNSPDNKRTGQAVLMALVVFGILYYLSQYGVSLPWLKSRQSERRYRPINEGLPGAASDDDSDAEDDQSARRRMLELSTLGHQGQNKDQRRPTDEEARQQPSRKSGGLSQAEIKEEAKRKKNDDAADRLQQDLELFAQDEEDEGSQLMGVKKSSRPTDEQQPQNRKLGWKATDNTGQDQDDQEFGDFQIDFEAHK